MGFSLSVQGQDLVEKGPQPAGVPTLLGNTAPEELRGNMSTCLVSQVQDREGPCWESATRGLKPTPAQTGEDTNGHWKAGTATAPAHLPAPSQQPARKEVLSLLFFLTGITFDFRIALDFQKSRKPSPESFRGPRPCSPMINICGDGGTFVTTAEPTGHTVTNESPYFFQISPVFS